MEYTIKVDIPDDLLAATAMLQHPEIHHLREELGLELRGVEPKPEQVLTFDQVLMLAKQITAKADKKDKAIAKLKEMGLTKLSDLQPQDYEAYYHFLQELTVSNTPDNG